MEEEAEERAILSGENEEGNILGDLVKSALNMDMDSFLVSPLRNDQVELVEACSAEGCTRTIGILSSQFACPSCAGHFCSTHAGHPSFQVTMDQGQSVRICPRCWDARPENLTGLGAMRSCFGPFEGRRREALDEAKSQKNLLETRLSQLIRIETDQNVVDKRSQQQKVVHWQPDMSSDSCSLCEEKFTSFRRRHHCRLCGRLICGDELTCQASLTTYQFTACKHCYRLQSSHNQIIKVDPLLHGKDPLEQLYQSMLTSRSQALQNLPKFNEYLIELEFQLKQVPRDQARIQAIQNDAEAIRDTLQLIFDHYEKAIIDMAGVRVGDGSQRDLVLKNIIYSGHQFIKTHRFSLKMLPGRLDLYEDQKPVDIPQKTPSGSQSPSLVASLASKFIPSIFTSATAEPKSPSIPLPANLGALMQRLQILQEQRSQLESFMEEAMVARRFGELPTLQTAIDEVDQEINRLKLICSFK